MRLRSSNVLIPVLLIFLALIITTKLCCAEANQKEPNDSDTEQAREKPMIIWLHNGAEITNPLSLKTALSSGLITHVMVLYMHKDDGRWQGKQRVREAIKIVKESDAKLIWCRTAWAWYAVKNSKPEDLFDPDHYIRVIRNLRAEAKEMGADFIALDTEPYALSPMKPYFKGKIRKRLSNIQCQQLKSAVKKAIQTAGEVDFIFPAGVRNPEHPYNFLVELGKLRISEQTYYDNEKMIKNIKYPYDIFGALLNPVKRNESWPAAPYFLASEIFEKSHLWSNKKGLFLCTHSRNSLAVARDLVAYSKTLPYK